MTLIKRDPWSLLDQWRHEMDQFLTTMDNDETRVVGSNWSPAVDIQEQDDLYLLHADIPGVKPEDIEVTMDKGILTIKGERKHSRTEAGEAYRRQERSEGVFIRRFSLPDNVDAENIKASSKDGVLELILPKAKQSKPKKITVKQKD